MKIFNKTLIGLILAYLGIIGVYIAVIWSAFKVHWLLGLLVSGMAVVMVGKAIADL